MIDPRKRYQIGLTLNDLYPEVKNLCACGCGKPLSTRQRKWASTGCRDKAFIHFAVIKGDSQLIRQQLFLTDHGACRCCGEITETWQADHIISVFQGGGGKGIENFQTLCVTCHKEKSYKVSHQSAISSQAASILLNRFLYPGGQHCNLSLKTSKEKQSLVLAVLPGGDRNFSVYT